jgi:hypothetical protein
MMSGHLNNGGQRRKQVALRDHTNEIRRAKEVKKVNMVDLLSI